MATTYQIDVALRLVRTHSSGVLTDESVADLYRRMGADPTFDRTFRQLCDLRDLDRLEVTSDGLRELAATSIFAPESRRAFVVGRDLDYGIARMFQAYCELAGASVGVFRDWEAAGTWLGIATAR
jgi:hypothetical protein